MNAVDTSRRRRLRPGVRRATLLLSAAVLSALAGCESGYGLKNDPFLGTPTPAIPGPLTPAANGGAPAGTQTPAGGVPALPGTHAMTSPAVLASGALPAPETPRDDLRINGPPIVPASSSGGAARGAAPSNVQVGGPEPVPETTSRLAPIAAAGGAGFQPTGAIAAGAPTPAASPPLTTPVAVMTFEDAQQYLKRRGVVWQRLETWGDRGQWKFRCGIPVPGNTGLNRTYETESPAADPVMALRSVIDKIEKDQR